MRFPFEISVDLRIENRQVNLQIIDAGGAVSIFCYLVPTSNSELEDCIKALIGVHGNKPAMLGHIFLTSCLLFLRPVKPFCKLT